MTAVRQRLAGTAGNNPQTMIFCDMTDFSGAGCDRNKYGPPTSWDAREARKIAASLGWRRIEGKDYCAAHVPSVLRVVNTLRTVAKPPMVMRSIRVPEKLWAEAKAKADEREENISDVLREALERYVKRR